MEIAPPEVLAVPAAGDVQDPPRFGRAVSALASAATIALAPVGGLAVAPADSGRSAHAIPVYLVARLSHDVGHNGWAFAGSDDGLVEWGACALGLGLFWLVAALWVRGAARSRGGARGLWWRMLAAAWGVEALFGCLTVGAGALAAWNSWPPDTFVLHAADLCSPWWSCVAVTLVVARAERNTRVLCAGLCYGLLLAVVLVVPLPFPAVLKALVLAVSAAVPALATADESAPKDADSSPATLGAAGR